MKRHYLLYKDDLAAPFCDLPFDNVDLGMFKLTCITRDEENKAKMILYTDEDRIKVLKNVCIKGGELFSKSEINEDLQNEKWEQREADWHDQ